MGLPVEAVIRRASDVDDGLVRRRQWNRQIEHLYGLVRRPSLPKETLADIISLNLGQMQQKDSSIMGWTERVSFYLHSKRQINEGRAKIIAAEVEAGRVEWHAISGRRDTRPWSQMTENQLITEGKLSLKSVRLKPKGISGPVNKAFWINELGIDEFDDDDGKRTIHYLAGIFQERQFNHIDYGIDSLSEEVLRDHPNIRVISAAEWLGIAQEDTLEGDSLTRNSSLRNTFAIKNRVGETLAKIGIDPNWITGIGGLLALGSIAELTRQNLDGKSHFFKVLHGAEGLATALTLDSIDGATADAKNKMKPGSHDTQFGGALDAAIDKIVAVAMSVAKMVIAYKRKDWYGLVVAAISGATHTLSALCRAKGEAEGEKFPESKSFFKDPLYFGGTQLGRNLSNIPTTIWSNAHIDLFGRKIYLQHLTDTYSALSNFYVAFIRSIGGQEIVPPPIPEKPEDYEKWQETCVEIETQKKKIMTEGAYRANWMRGVAKLGVGAVLITGAGLLVHHKLTSHK